MEPIILNSYNLAEAEETVIRRCFEDNPDAKNAQIAQMLGVSERTLYRIIDRQGFCHKYRQILKAKELLEKNGYTVSETIAVPENVPNLTP